ncbi:MAG TPA: phosphatase PAP2 family protein [Longimicrobiaceae bacterium]|nr:phosphatase PAP2 family protein [Longimicrobiaceae bacterium]
MINRYSTRTFLPPHPGTGLRWLVVALLLASSPIAAAAQARSWEPELWAGTGTVLVGAFLLDSRLRVDLVEGVERPFKSLSDAGNLLGRVQTVVPALGVAYGIGRLAGNRKLSTATLHTAAALAAAGAMNGFVKVGVGRRRPGADNDPTSFRPVALDDHWQSFPSGHTVVAFSLAAAIAEEAKQPWVTALTYGAAGVVGWSRIYEDRHWASDVVGGALIGTLSSKLTLRWLHARSPHDGEEGAGRGAVHFALLPGGFAVAITPPR